MKFVYRLIVAIFAIFMIIAGALTVFTPLPIGLPLFVLGFLILATAEPISIRWLRRHWRWLDNRLRWMQKNWPRWMTGALRRTDPYPEDSDDIEEENAETDKRS